VIVAALDANMIVSGMLVTVGISSKIIDAAYADVFRCVSSSVIVSEVFRTLGRDRVLRKYRVAQVRTERLREFLESRPVSVDITVEVHGVATHPEDDLILATAVSGQADYLVTGDRQLLALGSYQGVQIVTPRNFLAILEAEASA
jgi:putative PIN family toxin of toxin-antitoxin system